jgi:ABC-2 type transport system permease protein
VSARALLAQLRVELLLAARRGEALLVTMAVPPVLLVFFASLPLLPADDEAPVAFLLPGIIALAVIGNAMVALGIGTAYERHYGVLKRLGALPGSRLTLVLAKTLAVLLIEVVQIVVLVVVAVLLGWKPAGDPLAVALALVLGTAAFAGIGLLLAGTLRAEVTLALANGLFLAFLLLGGIVVPTTHLPGVLADIAPWLPAATLSEALRDGMSGQGGPDATSGALLPLAAWAAVALIAAAAAFRPEE